MRIKRKLIAFTVRPYAETDLQQLIRVYQRAFLEPPWNETWSAEEVEKDLRFAQAQADSIVLAAYDEENLVGFTWGYRFSEKTFPFLTGLISKNANYMDEIAVDSTSRCRGIGKRLGNSYLAAVSALGRDQSVLRTDERNVASMSLFAKIGYVPVRNSSTPVYDPEYRSRIYLQRWVL